MTRYSTFSILAAIIAACLALGAHAANKPPLTNADKKKMKMNEPMTTGMMKKGMMKGDVKSAADKKSKEIKPMIKQEEESMHQDTGKP